MDFLWHRISEKEREEIKKQVYKNLEDFSKKLSEIKEEVEPFKIIREKSFRYEEDNEKNLGKKNNLNDEINNESKEFRRLILKNAPNKNEDCIIAEKKKW